MRRKSIPSSALPSQPSAGLQPTLLGLCMTTVCVCVCVSVRFCDNLCDGHPGILCTTCIQLSQTSQGYPELAMQMLQRSCASCCKCPMLPLSLKKAAKGCEIRRPERSMPMTTCQQAQPHCSSTISIYELDVSANVRPAHELAVRLLAIQPVKARATIMFCRSSALQPTQYQHPMPRPGRVSPYVLDQCAALLFSISLWTTRVDLMPLKSHCCA